MKKISVLVLALVMSIALIAAGCGATEETPDPASETQDFLFALTGAYKPFSYFDEQNKLVGFDVEIGYALAEAMGMEGEAVATPWQSLIPGLKTNRYDAIIGSMTITDERLMEVDFTDPYYVSGAQLYVRGESDLASIDDVTGDTAIGVLTASVYEELAREHTDNLKFYDSDVTALKDLNLGRTDAVITDKIVGVLNAEQANLDIKPVGDILMVENIGIAVRKGEAELLDKLNQALKDIKADGTYLEISERYVGIDISGD